jgi:antitoxin (DNA-binding transcriptional repressor) of toxin-antitoxin stability system
MSTLNIEDAKGPLKDIIARLNPGDEVTIVQDGEPVATLVRTPPKQWPCKAGSYRKAEFWMAPDFDAPLEDFKEYME